MKKLIAKNSILLVLVAAVSIMVFSGCNFIPNDGLTPGERALDRQHRGYLQEEGALDNQRHSVEMAIAHTPVIAKKKEGVNKATAALLIMQAKEILGTLKLPESAETSPLPRRYKPEGASVE